MCEESRHVLAGSYHGEIKVSARAAISSEVWDPPPTLLVIGGIQFLEAVEMRPFSLRLPDIKSLPAIPSHMNLYAIWQFVPSRSIREYFLKYFIVAQLQSFAFAPHHSPHPSQTHLPPLLPPSPLVLLCVLYSSS